MNTEQMNTETEFEYTSEMSKRDIRAQRRGMSNGICIMQSERWSEREARRMAQLVLDSFGGPPRKIKWDAVDKSRFIPCPPQWAGADGAFEFTWVGDDGAFEFTWKNK